MTSSFYIRDNEDVENNKPKIAKSLFAKGDSDCAHIMPPFFIDFL